MISKQSEYMPLNDANKNTLDFSINVQEDRFSKLHGLMFLYIGSPKHCKNHVIEFKPGTRVQSKNYKFTYGDVERSSIILSLYNRKSFWSQDEKIGELKIPVCDFDSYSFDTREIQFDNHGPKMTIQGLRNESF
ncbi:hypothetical protein TVAG_474930 [Trichomonas vaginalis G3]|uniref:Uncharacterized protein n=1 Tax=Trichomonas vaginalis (strain ATCC PRA-98 / G3) TaxID=412133 RepID=A2ERP3_TRIV3|nr:hypothetical protein TVAGG3_0344770 [Trichomonas vaginalis G3]EAY04695.1 hypothetical protein TVAG_474930 [Trichomonas vaginalis G3]KAI5530895.1 hypothetical protein TVAGG3_0344770 [Trichomonas vaginalis G3]|eukprot:XP_001316918.1 hypothetical protein [Trichomonas vaginalis G3]